MISLMSWSVEELLRHLWFLPDWNHQLTDIAARHVVPELKTYHSRVPSCKLPTQQPGLVTGLTWKRGFCVNVVSWKKFQPKIDVTNWLQSPNKARRKTFTSVCESRHIVGRARVLRSRCPVLECPVKLIPLRICPCAKAVIKAAIILSDKETNTCTQWLSMIDGANNCQTLKMTWVYFVLPCKLLLPSSFGWSRNSKGLWPGLLSAKIRIKQKSHKHLLVQK